MDVVLVRAPASYMRQQARTAMPDATRVIFLFMMFFPEKLQWQTIFIGRKSTKLE